MSSAGHSPAFWVLCLNWTNFSWTDRYGRTPQPSRERSGTQTLKIRNQMRIVPGWSSSWSGTLRLSIPSFNWFRPRRRSSQKSIIHVFWMFCSSSKSLVKLSSKAWKLNISRTSFNSNTTTSELQTLVISLTFWPLSFYLLTDESVWVDINLIFLSSIVMRGKIVRLSVTSKLIAKTCKTKNIFRLANFESNPQNSTYCKIPWRNLNDMTVVDKT